MELRAVRALGVELLALHGLTSWRFAFDNAKRRAGACKFDTRTISVSRHLMALYSEEHVRDTILHEIAHALVGPKHGHDRVWRAKALAIGCSGSRLVDADAPRAPAPWRGTCPHGHTYDRHRRPARPASCTRCDRRFNPDYLLTWTFHGRATSPGPQYERELSRLLGARSRRGGDRAGLPIPGLPDAFGAAGRAAASAASDAAARGGTLAPERDPARDLAARGRLTPGTVVRITAPGKYFGSRVTILKSARTRYHVRRGEDRLTVPFAYVEPVPPR
ncbi:SprT-like family protein [Georgenia soli]|uniref:SprT-like family protein n=1 Tax=Georgenia soli TaxID=638953 RepID=A0A2A9EM23_9MICO|nr:SprT-like domain-containing protein [Georgenia soli]PFG39656.1 SprT-like family protein [Georgenia soli]